MSETAQGHAEKRWPFVESPEEFTTRLLVAMQWAPNLLSALRHVLIEEPAALSCLAGEGWRPISDAPKDGTHVLIAQRRGDSDKWSVLEGHFVKRSRRSRNGTWYGTGDYGEEEFSQQYEPTHWMPLPAAPSVEEKLP